LKRTGLLLVEIDHLLVVDLLSKNPVLATGFALASFLQIYPQVLFALTGIDGLHSLSMVSPWLSFFAVSVL